MNAVYINKAKYTVPGSFNELSRQQLLKIIALLNSGLQLAAYKLQALFVLVSFRKKDLKGVNAEHVYDMFALTEFTLGKISLTKNLMPQVCIQGKVYHGPKDCLSNIVFIEFIKCEKYFLDYAKTQNENSLNRLVAILYRPAKRAPNNDGDIRERYNDDLIDQRARALAQMNIHMRLAALYFYQGCREYIVNAFPEIFTEQEQGARPGKGSQGWVDVLINMAGTKFGDMEATGYTRLYTILATLKNNYYQHLEMEKLYK